ncbi:MULTISPECIES: PAS domain-containing sensor histidine kinase [unclassified Ensifer]|uniref:cell cycle histidine kinase CckA n=1 Tax=unclassified Ensifer TaxID=2633371 RepID=UPI000813C44B|nr:MULTISPECIES: PAS domain-containing sensor histidine kinase [unclassified Ensifer]OCP03447.1 hybrid sensor histidine kinase/response regulator [Ensifer sp. LC11]OCP03754.1 hybrid sensor histidine kinase/response regulator [Ensifer sp. LC13]OCP08453.1 hybrid sensor histidine kinase/response regulator [Ensifer sp. LC14]OCP30225.1 hybrid sensor histidine kinase/response regulator [Ensifer sp. LC499]
MTKLRQSGDYQMPVVDRGVRPGTVLRIVLLAIVLTVSAIAFVIFKNEMENEIVLGILGVLAMVGIFFLVSSVIGFIEVMPQSRPDELARAFLDAHEDGTIVTDRKGRIIYANAAYGALTGAKNAAGIQSLETILSRNREATEAIYRLTNGLHEGKQGHEEFRLLKPLATSASSGSGAHWFRLKARVLPLEDSERNPLYLWQIADITAERDDQERFFKELQNAIDYLDHAPAGFFSAGRKGEIFYINATLADWLGIDLTKFQPGSISIGDLVAGEGLTLVQAVQAEPGLKKTKMLDLDLRKLNGQSLPVRLIHRVSSTRDGAPGESRTIVMSREGGEDSEQSASSAAMRFTRFFNNTPMAIASVDGNGRILRTNAPFLKLFSGLVSQDDVERGALIEAVVHQTEKGRLHEALAAAKDRQGDIAPIDALHPTDGERHFRFYVNAVIDQSDQAPEEAAIIYALEITEQKALENQMAQTQKMNAVGTLAGGIAHDFNNVLTAILLSSDHLLLSARPADPSFADLMEIKRNANRAAVLVRQLLAFSRKQTMRPTVLNMTDVIGDLRMLVDRMTGTNVKVEVDYGRDLWPVRTDLGQFEQVLLNLAVNARDAMPGGGTITLRTRNLPAAEVAAFGRRELPEEDFVMVEVSDQGTGIAPEILDKIFEPFFTTKEVGKGTGLGLSMVYGIVKQSGGYIYPDSEVGKGTTFRILLPRHIEVPAAAEEPTQGATATGETGPAPAVKVAAAMPVKAEEPTDLTGDSAVVLLVEDEEAVRRGGKRMLETRGYTVYEAGSGVEALDIMDELNGAVDIVVSDVVMPEMDGPTLLTELRKKYPDLKFIFVSGYAEDAFARNLPADAKFGFLPKPFSLKQLAVAVREMLDS